MQVYLSILEELKEAMEKPNQRSWEWMKFWKRPTKKSKTPCEDPEREGLIDQPQETEVPKNLPEIVLDKRRAEQRTPEAQSRRNQGFYFWLLGIIRFFGRDDS